MNWGSLVTVSEAVRDEQLRGANCAVLLIVLFVVLKTRTNMGDFVTKVRACATQMPGKF